MSIKNHYSEKSWDSYYDKIEPKLSKTIKDGEVKVQNGTLCVGDTEVCSFIFDVKCIKQQVFENKTIETILIEVCQIDPDCSKYNFRVSEPEIFEIDRSQKGKPANFSKILGAKYVIYDEKVFKEIWQRMIVYAPTQTEIAISSIGHQSNGCYAFANGMVGMAGKVQDDDVSYQAVDKIRPFSLQVEPDITVDHTTEVEAAKLITEHWFKATLTPVAVYLYCLMILSFLTTPLRKLFSVDSPRFITLLFAEPLSGKTTMCEIMLSFMKSIPRVDLSNDTTTAGILEDVKCFKDCVYLTDDFKVPPTNRKAIEERVNTLTRMGGNLSAKKTFNGTYSIDSMILMTAEAIPGLSKSSIERMLIFKMRKADFAYDEENKIANNPELYGTHILMVLRWILGQDMACLCNNLHDGFLAERARLKSNKSFCDRRVDAYAWLIATYQRLILPYFESIGLESENRYDRLKNYALRDLRDHLRMELPKDTLYKFCSEVNNADDFDEYSYRTTPDLSKLGLQDRDYFYIFQNKLTELIDKDDPVDLSMLLEILDREGILRKETSRTCRTTRKNFGDKTILFYRLSRSRINEYLDKINEEIRELEETPNDDA